MKPGPSCDPTAIAATAPGGPPPRGTSRRFGIWSLVTMVAAVAAGSFVGGLWLPLGLFAAAAVGTCLDGVGVAVVGVLGTLLGAPVLRVLLHSATHSWLYAPAAAAGLLLGMLVRRGVASRLRG